MAQYDAFDYLRTAHPLAADPAWRVLCAGVASVEHRRSLEFLDRRALLGSSGSVYLWEVVDQYLADMGRKKRKMMLQVLAFIANPGIFRKMGAMDSLKRRYLLLSPSWGLARSTPPPPLRVYDVAMLDMLYRLHVAEIFAEIMATKFVASPWNDENVLDEWRKRTGVSMFKGAQGARVFTERPPFNAAQILDTLFSEMAESSPDVDILRVTTFYADVYARTTETGLNGGGAPIFDRDLVVMHSDQATLKDLGALATPETMAPLAPLALTGRGLGAHTAYTAPFLTRLPVKKSRYIAVDNGGSGECFFCVVNYHIRLFSKDYFDARIHEMPPGDKLREVALARFFDDMEPTSNTAKNLSVVQIDAMFFDRAKLFMRDLAVMEFLQYINDNWQTDEKLFSGGGGDAAKDRVLYDRAISQLAATKSMSVTDADLMVRGMVMAFPFDIDDFRERMARFWDGIQGKGYFVMTTDHDRHLAKYGQMKRRGGDGSGSWGDLLAAPAFKLCTALLKKNIEDLASSGGYVSSSHLVAVARALRINLFMATDDTRRENLIYYFDAVCPNAYFNCFLYNAPDPSGATSLGIHYLTLLVKGEEVDPETWPRDLRARLQGIELNGIETYEDTGVGAFTFADDKGRMVTRKYAITDREVRVTSFPYTSGTVKDTNRIIYMRRYPPRTQAMTALRTPGALEYIWGDLRTRTPKSLDEFLAYPLACTYTYFHAPRAMALFFHVWYGLLVKDDPRGCLFTQIRYVHTIVAALNAGHTTRMGDRIDNHTGRIDFRDGEEELGAAYHALELPAALGFSRNKRGDTGVWRLRLRRADYTDDNYARLRELVQSVALQSFVAMQSAAVLVAYFMYTPPPTYSEGESITKDTDFIRAMSETLTSRFHGANKVSNDARVFPELFMAFHEKSFLQGFVSTPDIHGDIVKFVKLFLLYQPDNFHKTAFFEFYAVCLHAMYEMARLAHDKNDQMVMNFVAPTAVRLTKPPTGKSLTGRGFQLDIRVAKMHENAFTKRFVEHDHGYVLVWFTSTNNVRLVPLAPSSTSGPIHRYLADTRIAYTQVSLSTGSSSGHLQFEILDLRKTGSDEGGPKVVYMHLAMVVREKTPTGGPSYFIRRGHACVDLDDIDRPGHEFAVTLWEGPTSTEVSWKEDLTFDKSMAYERVFDLGVTVVDPQGVFEPRESPGSSIFTPWGAMDSIKASVTQWFCRNEPCQMFQDADMVAVNKYLWLYTRAFSAQTQGLHAWLYVNMPLSRNVVPLFAVAYLPPTRVDMDFLVERIQMKLDDEALSWNEFLQISVMAFAPERARLWCPWLTLSPAEIHALSAYAMGRFVWILTQIINPYSKFCYRYDLMDGNPYEQMNYPTFEFADCEDLAEAVMRLVQGIQALYVQSRAPEAYPHKAVYLVLQFLAGFTPAMTVLTTQGAAYTRGVAAETARPSLHMLAVLLPVKAGLPVIPLETTGLNYNSYETPDLQLRDVPDGTPFKEALLEREEMYNRICALAVEFGAVSDERISFAVRINREVSEVIDSPGSGKKGDEFIRPHYFYDRFIMACDTARRQLVDFYYDGADKRSPGVLFADAVGSRRKHWTLAAPVMFTDEPRIMATLERVCTEFAANVQPAPAFIRAVHPVAEILPGTQPPADMATALGPRSVNFYLNESLDADASKLMSGFRAFMEGKRGVFTLSPVQRVVALGGKLTFYKVTVVF